MSPFPSENFTLVTTDSRAVILERLTKQVGWWYSHASRPFRGTIEEDGFSLMGVPFWYHSFVVLVGEFQSCLAGTTIHVTIRMPWYVIGVQFWLWCFSGIFAWMFVNEVGFAGGEWGTALLGLGGCALFGWAGVRLIQGFFHHEAKIRRKELTDILLGDVSLR